LNVKDVGGGIIIHTFGAFYGIGMCFFTNYKHTVRNKNIFQTHNSYTYTFIGMLLVWTFMPSFNASLSINKKSFF